jgi:hypothetical protein
MSSEQKASFKHPNDFCACMTWMIDSNLIRLGEGMTNEGATFPYPIIESGRGRNSQFTGVKFCPNCGAKNFVIDEPQDVAR